MTRSKKEHLALDRYLKVLYCSIRHSGRLMAIEFEHAGKKYRVDTVEEAVALRYRLEQHDVMHGSYSDAQRVWTPDLVMELLNGVGELQRQFLSVLCGGLAGYQSETITATMGLDSEVALAGVVSGLSKQLRKMSIRTADVYHVDVRWNGKHKVRTFIPSPDFQESVTELGFPDAWEKSEKKGAQDAASTIDKRK
jgi:hypothetical protein